MDSRKENSKLVSSQHSDKKLSTPRQNAGFLKPENEKIETIKANNSVLSNGNNKNASFLKLIKQDSNKSVLTTKEQIGKFLVMEEEVISNKALLERPQIPSNVSENLIIDIKTPPQAASDLVRE